MKTRKSRWLINRIKHDPTYPTPTPPPEPEPTCGAGVGLILGIRDNGVPRLPSQQAWDRAVPAQYRRPSKIRTIN